MNCGLLVSRKTKKEQVAIMRKVKTQFEQIPIDRRASVVDSFEIQQPRAYLNAKTAMSTPLIIPWITLPPIKYGVVPTLAPFARKTTSPKANP